MTQSDMWGTPPALADAIVAVLAERYGWTRNPTFMDPACGKGAFLESLMLAGRFHTLGIELDHSLAVDAREFSIVLNNDALVQSWSCDVTLTNPPFSRALEFVAHCREMSPLVALVLPLHMLEPTKTKRTAYRNVDGGFYRELRTVYPFPRTSYIPLADNGTDSRSNSRPDGLFVWQRGYTGATEIDYSIARRLMARAQTQEVGA